MTGGSSSMNVSIGVAIPSIETRQKMLVDALSSVWHQTLPVRQTNVAFDITGQGAAATRNRAWRGLDTDWVAFLDDDDVFYNRHLEQLHDCAVRTGADMVYPWFDVYCNRPGTPHGVGYNPIPPFLLINQYSAEGHAFDQEAMEVLMHRNNFIPITVLVRRSVLETVGGFDESLADNEDWACWKAMVTAGAKIVHLPLRTWVWRWHMNHTMGRPSAVIRT